VQSLAPFTCPLPLTVLDAVCVAAVLKELEDGREAGVWVNVGMCSAVMDGFVKAGRPHDVLQLFDSLPHKGIHPVTSTHPVTCTSNDKACVETRRGMAVGLASHQSTALLTFPAAANPLVCVSAFAHLALPCVQAWCRTWWRTRVGCRPVHSWGT
jgi:pentatricopeptide repeat protein